MKAIRVHLHERSYEIRFGSIERTFPKTLHGLLGRISRVLIVTSRAILKAGHARRLESSLRRSGFRVHTVVLPNGETQKNLRTVSHLYEKGLKFSLDRKSLIVALGGGVVTDTAGFFAATYMRGISFVAVPSTVLGMVDAAIGGKTGVDVPEGKNLVGAFWQPRLVWIDLSLLRTLPKREWRTGFAEVIKYGVIKRRPFFEWLEHRVQKNPQFSTWSRIDVEKAVRESARIKAEVVSGDEREAPLKGGREILNFGHTAGHALEAAKRYRALSHGEAISVGMVLAGRVALSLGFWSSGDQLCLVSLLEAAGLPIHFPKLSLPEEKKFWSALKKDKKHVSGHLRFVLPKTIGRVTVRSVPFTTVRQAAWNCGLNRA